MVNKKIILSVLIIGCLATVAGAGTWAYFDDTQASTGNTITTGTLKLDTTQSAFSAFTFDNIAPGDDKQDIKELTVKNIGSLDGYLYATVSVDSPNDVPDNLAVYLTYPKNKGKGIGSGDREKVNIAKGETNINLGQLTKDETRTFKIGYVFTDTGTSQDGQGKTLHYTITYHLVQKQLNS